MFTVPLPVDSGHRAPRLRLSGSTQVAQDSTVFLMVYFDGKQVYEEQLARGDNRLDRAIDRLNDFVVRHPKNGRVWLLLAGCLEESGRMAEADAARRRGRSDDPRRQQP